VPRLGQRIVHIDLAATGGVVLQGAVTRRIGLDHPGVGAAVITVRPTFRQDLHVGRQDGDIVFLGEGNGDGATAFGVRALVDGPDLKLERLAGL
jgi:hypothetical protein